MEYASGIGKQHSQFKGDQAKHPGCPFCILYYVCFHVCCVSIYHVLVLFYFLRSSKSVCSLVLPGLFCISLRIRCVYIFGYHEDNTCLYVFLVRLEEHKSNSEIPRIQQQTHIEKNRKTTFRLKLT